MADQTELWTLMQETFQSLMPFYHLSMRQAIAASGAPDNWFYLSLARGSEPEALTMERLQALAPYAAPGATAPRIEQLVEQGLLEPAAPDAYRLTDQGRAAVEGIFDAAHQCLETVQPLPAGRMERLHLLLARLVQATLDAPEPAEKWALALSRWTDPGEQAPAAARLDQYLTDLYRYRDDAHVAAWQPHDIAGHAWEALTFIWRGDAGTAAELAEQLQPYRAYSAEDYEQALADLVSRGWVVEEDGSCKLTDEGKKVREQAEADTDRHHFVGWSALSPAELAELYDLLAQANKGLIATSLQLTYATAREVGQAIFPLTGETVYQLFQQHELIEPGMAFLASRGAEPDPRRAGNVSFTFLLMAQRFAPDPLSLKRLRKLHPYGNPAQFTQVFEALAERGFLQAGPEGEYTLRSQGRATLKEALDGFYTFLGEIAVLSPEELSQLAALVKRVSQSCREAPEPADKPYLSLVHRGHPDAEYAPLAKIDQHLDELNAFRDDAHIAAWQPYGVSGPAWEALTLIWRDAAHTAQELLEQLPFRNHSLEVYQEALGVLAERGWIAEAAGGYQITEEGAALRQEAEEATDRYFFGPWAVLTAFERNRLYALLARLRDGLRELAE